MVLISFRLTRLLIKYLDDLVLTTEIPSRSEVIRRAIFNLLCLEGYFPKSHIEELKSKNDAAPSISDFCGDCKQFTPAVFNIWEDECLLEPECKLKNIIITPDHPACSAFKKKKETIEVVH